MKSIQLDAGLAAACACVLALASAPAAAWVYPEHRDIALLGVETLDPARRAAFDGMWHEARAGDGARLCEQAADTTQGLTPNCIDWAAMSAIAGDHSCSSQDMLDIVLGSTWILNVADVAAQLKVDLGRIPVVPPADLQPLSEQEKAQFVDLQRRMQTQALRAERLNALRTSDTRLQRADPEYATRAGANNAHFLLARPGTDTTALSYAELAVTQGAELNAIGVYGTFHLSALQKASRLAGETLTPLQRRELTLSMLADEAFALHFLEDVYAAGHVAGTWGDASLRKGTHDHYNEHGLEAVVWGSTGSSVVLMGDAHMRPQDAALAAKAVRKSLEQLIDVATGKGHDAVPHTPLAPARPNGFDVCKSTAFPKLPDALATPRSAYPLFAEVMLPTPVPGLGQGLGSLPRFRTELGPFLGLASSIDARHVGNGFVPSQTAAGAMVGLDLSLRAGMGLEGVIGDGGDGLVFASLGLRADSASTNRLSDSLAASQGGSITAAIPSRIGISTRLRMPFYLIPGDLLLLSPMLLFAPQTYANMAVAAGNGGLIPWQLGWSTGIGRFQFVLGRELGVTFYGWNGNDRLLVPGMPPTTVGSVVNLKSVLYDLPILEYRPYRSFASNQSSSIVFQLFAGADVPTSYNVLSPPNAPQPNLDTVWSIGLRMVFDWRYYR